MKSTLAKKITRLLLVILSAALWVSAAFASTSYHCTEMKDESRAIITVSRKMSGEVKKVTYQDSETGFSTVYIYGREEGAYWLNAGAPFDETVFKHLDLSSGTLGLELKLMKEDQNYFLAFLFLEGDSMKSGCGYFRTCTVPAKKKLYRCKMD